MEIVREAGSDIVRNFNSNSRRCGTARQAVFSLLLPIAPYETGRLRGRRWKKACNQTCFLPSLGAGSSTGRDHCFSSRFFGNEGRVLFRPAKLSLNIRWAFWQVCDWDDCLRPLWSHCIFRDCGGIGVHMVIFELFRGALMLQALAGMSPRSQISAHYAKAEIEESGKTRPKALSAVLPASSSSHKKNWYRCAGIRRCSRDGEKRTVTS